MLLLLGGVLISLTYVLVETRKTVKNLTSALSDIERSLVPALEELKGTLANTREITGNINGITGDIRQVSEAVGHAGEELEEIVELLGEVKVKARANIGGLKAGFRAAYEILTDNFARKGGRS